MIDPRSEMNPDRNESEGNKEKTRKIEIEKKACRNRREKEGKIETRKLRDNK